MEPIIDVKIKSLGYDGKILVHDIDFVVEPKEKILLIGETGTGKTSFMHTMNLMNNSYEGIIKYRGKLVKDYNVSTLRSEIIEVMQEPFLGAGTVKESILLPFAFASNALKIIDDSMLYKLLDKFKLPREILAQNISNLSGGEKQRISIIRALLLEPAILLLDEPSSALDQATSEILLDYLCDEWKGTLFVISHDILWQERFNRILCFENKSVKEIRR